MPPHHGPPPHGPPHHGPPPPPFDGEEFGRNRHCSFGPRHRGGQPVLIYFDHRGLAEPIRLTFLLGGVPFEDRRISKADWNRRYKNYSPTGEAPLLEVDGRVIVQSRAILQYAATRAGLQPETDEQQLAALTITSKIGELHQKYREVWFSTDDEAERKRKIQEVSARHLPDLLTYLNSSAGLGQELGLYALGTEMTYIDAVITALLDELAQHDIPFDLAQYPKLRAIQTLVKTNSQVAAYIRRHKVVKPKLYSSGVMHNRAHATRWAFAIGKIDFEDIHLTEAEFEERKRSEPQLRLPYMEVDGKRYYDDAGMLYYAASKANLVPRCATDVANAWAIIRTIEAVVMSFQYQKEELRDRIEKLDYLVSLYQDEEGHCVGRRLSFADVAVAVLYMALHQQPYSLTLDLNELPISHLHNVYTMVKTIPTVREFDFKFTKIKPVLTYFDIEGRAEPIRVLLRICKIDFEDRRVTGEQWRSTYKALSPTGQCPYLEFDGVLLAETKAILSYVAERGDMLPPTCLGRARAEMIFHAFDRVFLLLGEVWKVPEGPERETKKMEIRGEPLQTVLLMIEKMSAQHQHPLGYLVDNTLTWIDVYIGVSYRTLENWNFLLPDHAEKYPALNRVTLLIRKMSSPPSSMTV